MSDPNWKLGKLVSVHAPSARSLQRAVVVAILSFVFFFAALIVFYATGRLPVFVLSSAFLVVYLFTMIGIWMRKRGTVRVYENGISYKNWAAAWDQIDSARADRDSGITLTRSDGEKIVIDRSVSNINDIALAIRAAVRDEERV